MTIETMREAFGDMWEMYGDLHCITTNGAVARSGRAVMGRGCALEAKQRFPGIDRDFGALLQRYGNRVMIIDHWAPFSPASSKSGWTVASFPVKHMWYERADLGLIRRSCEQLLQLLERKRQPDGEPYRDVVLARPGCGNGGRSWSDEVKPILLEYFGADDRITIAARLEEAPPGYIEALARGEQV